MKRNKRSSHDKLPVRRTNDRDVHLHHVVSRHGDHLLEQEAIEEESRLNNLKRQDDINFKIYEQLHNRILR